MISWSVNYLFLVNAGLLALLAVFPVSRKRTPITWIFCATTGALALWNVCIYLLEERLLLPWVGLVVSAQLISAMVFANGLYYFCSSYPVYRRERSRLVNLVVFAGFALAIVFTHAITEVSVQGGDIVYRDGLGYLVYSLYLSLLGLSALFRLVSAWRHYPEHRARIRYFFIGVATYVVCAIAFNLILPSFGNYDYLMVGRLSATVAPVLFFYAITKHDFLDTTIIISKGAAWAGALACMLALGILLYELTQGGEPWLNLLAMIVAVVVAGFYTQPLQRFLLTSAKRKFIRGWYSTEEVINRLSGRITQEKNREAIFREVARVLDEVFEVEELQVIVAVRDEQQQFSYYRVAGRFQKIRADDPLMEQARQWQGCLRLGQAPALVHERLRALSFQPGHHGIVLPFHSPEYLEGLLILGERSNQIGYSESDLRFFNNLIHYLAPVLYRLTPMEKLERLYLESRQKLHEAEIQLLRAQKIEAIVHATRQCHHEIRTPLNIIRMGIGRIRDLDGLEAYKQIACEEIDHALEIVEETLAITDMDKAEASRFQEVDVNSIIKRCLRVVDRSRYRVQLELSEVSMVLAVSSDLQVVLTNLIHNALEAMPGGGVLTFTTRSNGSDVTLTVEDDGEGIPAMLRSRVWEPYFSGRGSDIGNSNAGRGWGLTIVNRIITEHRGTIRFTSEERVGTRFIITLPAAISSAGIPAANGSAVQPATHA